MFFLFFYYLMIVEDPSVEKSLDILHLNIRSIRNKIDSLMYLVHDFDILCFTETHLDINVLNENPAFYETIKLIKMNC